MPEVGELVINKVKAVDLFAGAGGFSLGLLRAGFRLVLANEFSVDPEWTYRANLLPHTIQADLPQLPTHPSPARLQEHRKKCRELLLCLRERDELTAGDHMRGGDIKRVLNNEWLRNWLKTNGEIDLVVGGPPCQGFSSAGKRDLADARNELVKQMLRVALQIAPKVIIIENVPGMLTRHSDVIQHIVTALSTGNRGRPGYRCALDLIEGQRFGVPQTRRRLLIIGVRRDLVDHILPEELGHSVFPSGCPRHRHSSALVESGDQLSSEVVMGDLNAPPYYTSDSCHRVGYSSCPVHHFHMEVRTPRDIYLDGRTIEEAVNATPYCGNHERSRHSPRVEERMSRLHRAASSSEDGRRNRCSTGWLRSQYAHAFPELETRKVAQRVLISDLWPKLTVTSLPDDIVHYREARIPTVREMARLQTFPDWFTFHGVRTTGHTRRRAGVYVPQYTQVANAVPPRLGFAIASHIRSFIEHIGASKALVTSGEQNNWWQRHPQRACDILQGLNLLAMSHK